MAFNPSTYEIEDPISFKNDAGILKERECAVDNIIRYRVVDGASDNIDDVETGIQGKAGKKVSSQTQQNICISLTN